MAASPSIYMIKNEKEDEKRFDGALFEHGQPYGVIYYQTLYTQLPFLDHLLDLFVGPSPSAGNQKSETFGPSSLFFNPNSTLAAQIVRNEFGNVIKILKYFQARSLFHVQIAVVWSIE